MLHTGVIEDSSKRNGNAKIINTYPSVKDTVDALSLPQTTFHTWSGFKPIVAPTSATVYQLKQGYSLPEVKSLARKLSAFDTVKNYENFVMSYTLGKKGQAASLLVFNKNTGEFSYTATSGVPLPADKETVEDNIYTFLKNIDLYDPTLKIIASYKRHADPDLTYYEIKRDWKTTGLPILNPIGLLNLEADESIRNLEPNARTTALRTNTDIYDTSDNKDGLERNTDFNTITLVLSDETNSVVILKSNIRQVESGKIIQVPVISYDEAMLRLKNNQQAFILTTPENVADSAQWHAIYPNNIADAKEATIIESSISYLEQSPSAEQNVLEPYYIFRGTAELSNNYTINFIAAVSAMNKTQADNPNPFSFFLIPPVEAQIGQIGSQKQGKFDLIETPSPPPTPTAAFATCIPAREDLNPLHEQNATDPNLRSRVAYGWSPIAIIKGQVKISRRGWWYYVPSPNTTEATLRDDVNQVFIQIRSITNRRDFRKFNDDPPPNILSDFRATGSACPIRVTGDSPTIFIYAPADMKITVWPSTSIRYANPSLRDGSWNVRVNHDGTLQANDTKQTYLYYEYEDVTFDRPSAGWTVKKNDLRQLADTVIGSGLKLNSQEQERLQYELDHAAENVVGDTIFVGLIDLKEIQKKLPLQIDPVSKNIQRYFFYVGKTDGELHDPPHLSTILRTEYMLLEFGSYAEK